jgi:photosystem II stability/assembly factor-like uncharacterized protein
MITPSVGWGWGQDLVVRTTDGGTTLTGVTPRNPGGVVYDGSVLDATHAWILAKTNRSGYSRVFRSADGGRRWFSSLIPGGLDQLTFVDARHGWAEFSTSVKNHYALRVTLLRTVDGGAHWTVVYRTTQRIPVEPNVQTGQCQWSLPRFVTPLHGIVGLTCDRSERLQVDMTDDGGGHWHRIQLPTMPHQAGRVFFSSVQRPFVSGPHAVALAMLCVGRTWSCTEYGSLYRSDDGGRTWRVGKTVVHVGITAIEADLRDAWLPYACLGSCGRTPLLLRTQDGGAHWTALRLPARLGPNLHGGVRFQLVSASAGFAVEQQEFDPRTHFYRTTDGGRTFTEFQPRLVS